MEMINEGGSSWQQASSESEGDGAVGSPSWLHPPKPCTAARVVGNIEGVVLALLAPLEESDFPVQPGSTYLASSSQYNMATHRYEEKEVEPDAEGGSKETKNLYAGRRHRMEHLAKDMAVLSKSHELVRAGRKMNLRELYYQQVALFKGQTTLNRTVLRAAHRYLGIKRSDLGIVAAAKGLVAGRLQLIFPVQDRESTEDTDLEAAGELDSCPQQLQTLQQPPAWLTAATPIPSNIADATLHAPGATFCLVRGARFNDYANITASIYADATG